MTLQFSPNNYPQPGPSRTQQNLDALNQTFTNINGMVDQNRKQRLEDFQMELLKQKQAREQSEDSRKMIETRGEWGTSAPLSMTTPIDGPMTQGQGIRTALDPSSPASPSQPSNMVERFRTWQQSRRNGGPVQPEMGMPQPNVGYNEVLPTVPGFTPDQVRAVGGAGRTTMGTKQTEQLTKLFPREKPETPSFSPYPGALSKNGKPLVINNRTGEVMEASISAVPNSSTKPNVPAGYRLKDDGETLEPIAGGPADKSKAMAIPGYAPSGEVKIDEVEARKLRDGVSEFNTFKSGLSEYRTLIQTHGTQEMADRSVQGQMDAYAKNLQLKIKNLAQLGVLSFSDIPFIEKQIPGPGVFRTEAGMLGALDTAEKMMEKAVNDKLSISGYRPSGGGEGGGMIRVKNLQTGQTGRIPIANFNPTRYQKL